MPCSPFTTFVALLWAHSDIFVSLLHCGEENSTQCLRWGHINSGCIGTMGFDWSARSCLTHLRVQLAFLWKYCFYLLSPFTSEIAASLRGVNQKYDKIPQQNIPQWLYSTSIPAGIVLHIYVQVSLKIPYHSLTNHIYSASGQIFCNVQWQSIKPPGTCFSDSLISVILYNKSNLCKSPEIAVNSWAMCCSQGNICYLRGSKMQNSKLPIYMLVHVT